MTRDPYMIEVVSDLELEFELDFDDDEGLVVSTAAFQFGDENEQEVLVSVDELVDDCVVSHKEVGDYAGLYSIAHELNRHSEKAREAALLMEDSDGAVAGFFDLDPGDLG